jgi:hypothetical protein
MTTTTAPDTDVSPGSLITRDGQIEWAGLLLGPGTPYQIAGEGLSGWADLPELDSTDANRPTAHGAWPGSRWAQSRIVTAGVWLLPEDSATAGDLLEAFVGATAAEDTEQWLAVRLHGRTTAVRARVRQRVIPLGATYATGGSTRASVQWVATDPRRYDPQQQSVTVRLPQYGTGLPYPLTYPLAYGDPSVGGSAVAADNGNAPVYPTVVFSGPVTRPRLISQRTGRVLEYDLQLAAEEQLVVDTSEGTVLLGGSASRIHTATADSAPEQTFVLLPGDNPLDFRSPSGEPAANVELTWRSASL